MQAATAIANGGLLLAPRIVTKILSPTGELVKEFGRQPLREVVSPQVAREMLEMMAAAAGEGGTARRGSVEGMRISAKTGTAQVRDPATGTYSESNYVASYLGIFPTEEPRIILYVVLHNPKGPAYYGSQIAAPVFRGVAEDLIGYLGILRRGDVVLEQPGSLRVTVPPALVLGESMPDLRGTPKRLLLPLLAVPGLEVRISGDGFVAEQDPPPGTRLQAGASIRLRLE